MLTPYRLACLLGLLLAVAGSPAWAQCTDSDGDGICDDVDLCTNTGGVTIENQFLRLRKVSGEASSRFYYVGTVTGLGNATIDPVANGLRLRVLVPGTPERADITTVDVIVPSGAYDQAYNRGWASDGSGTFAYRDSHGIYSGIMRVLIKRVEAGGIKIVVFGQNGVFPLPLTSFPVDPRDDPFTLDVPIAATVVLDPPYATTGLCGEGALTECRYRNRGRKLLCI